MYPHLPFPARASWTGASLGAVVSLEVDAMAAMMALMAMNVMK